MNLHTVHISISALQIRAESYFLNEVSIMHHEKWSTVTTHKTHKTPAFLIDGGGVQFLSRVWNLCTCAKRRFGLLPLRLYICKYMCIISSTIVFCIETYKTMLAVVLCLLVVPAGCIHCRWNVCSPVPFCSVNRWFFAVVVWRWSLCRESSSMASSMGFHFPLHTECCSNNKSCIVCTLCWPYWPSKNVPEDKEYLLLLFVS